MDTFDQASMPSTQDYRELLDELKSQRDGNSSSPSYPLNSSMDYNEALRSIENVPSERNFDCPRSHESRCRKLHENEVDSENSPSGISTISSVRAEKF